MRKLAGRRIHNAKVQVFSNPVLAPPPDAFRGGPVLEGADLQELRQHRWGQVSDGTRPGEEYGAHIAGEVAYAGPLLHHFGHFVAEAVHRILPARHYFDAKRFLFIAARGDHDINSYDRLPQYNKDVLQFLEVDGENSVVITENAIVDDLIVAEHGAGIGSPSHPEYLDLMREYATRRLMQLHGDPLPSRKVYVCGKRKGGGIILGAAYVEALLEADGFWIFRPEDHPISFQLHVYHQAEMLIFSEGSAIHTTSLLGRDMMNKVSVLIRRPGSAGNFRRELTGRCRRLNIGFCCSFLGTSLTDSINPEPAIHLGVSLYNVQGLRHFLIAEEVESFHRFDHQQYFAACEEDLLLYMKECFAAADLLTLGTTYFAQIFARFELAKASTVN